MSGGSGWQLGPSRADLASPGHPWQVLEYSTAGPDIVPPAPAIGPLPPPTGSNPFLRGRQGLNDQHVWYRLEQREQFDLSSEKVQVSPPGCCTPVQISSQSGLLCAISLWTVSESIPKYQIPTLNLFGYLSLHNSHYHISGDLQLLTQSFKALLIATSTSQPLSIPASAFPSTAPSDSLMFLYHSMGPTAPCCRWWFVGQYPANLVQCLKNRN